MPGILDILKQIGAGGGQALGNAMQAQGNPLAFQAQQAAQRQKEAEAFQAQQGEAQRQQQDFQNQFQMALGINSGQLQQVEPGTPGAISGAYAGGLNVLPKPQKQFDIPAQSDLGHWLDLDNDITGIPMDSYLKLAQGAALQREKYNAQNQTRQAIDLAGVRLKDHINKMFTPERYMQLYGQVDPDLADRRQAALDDAEAAMAADRKLATGTTEINRKYEELSKGTPWEQRMLKQQQQKETKDIQLSSQQSMYDYEHPAPSPEEVKRWADNIEQNGATPQTASELKGIHPQMMKLVDEELTRRGTSWSNISTEMQNNHAKASIALDTMKEMQPYLDAPGMKDSFGPIAGRWKEFMSGVGPAPNQAWKHVSNKLHLMESLVRNMHFGVRGAANIEIKKEFDKIANADKMDYPTLQTGLRDFNDLLELYHREGLTSGHATSTTGAPGKPRKYINVNGVMQPNPAYQGQ